MSNEGQSSLESHVLNLLQTNRAGLPFERIKVSLGLPADFPLHTALGSLMEKGYITRRVDLYVIVKRL
jgi:hypothetical protein